MDHLDDFPKRDSNHEVQEIAETAFRKSISEYGCFVIQQEDRYDYGTDFQLEVIDSGGMTNIRVHVQLKGTGSSELADESVSISIDRTNLNYLLQQSYSIYVCYHLPTERLLFRYAEDVYKEYEHKGYEWRSQKTVTVNFIALFDSEFQSQLKNRSSSLARSSRSDRLQFAACKPNDLLNLIKKTSERVIVPADSNQAKAMLNELYNAGKDEIISNSFEQFKAVLASLPECMLTIYMAEINLGVNGLEFDEARVNEGIKEIKRFIDLGGIEKGSLHYSMGNGWLALKNYKRARDSYNAALVALDRPELAGISAQCYKNMGSVMEHLSNDDSVAISFYQRALEYSPQLSEAHYALALCYRKKQDFSMVLKHLDQVVLTHSSYVHNLNLQGWRLEALFYNGDAPGAHREINALIPHADESSWIWLWCVRQVMLFGRDSRESALRAISFWERYLQAHPEDIKAKQERLFCLLYIHLHDEDNDADFGSFKAQAVEIIDDDEVDTAFLWDRIGHWAQHDEDWKSAEACYREAYQLEPELYGYCLGTALNFLGKFEESYPILLDQAENHTPDEKSWFQVAVACEGCGDVSGSISAYRKAIDIDPEYSLAWFNLGGLYWNSGSREDAKKTWGEAIRKFPDHELAEELRKRFSEFIVT